jgi:WD40 repeat protein
LVGTGIAFSSDGRELALSVADRVFRLDVESGQILARRALGYEMETSPPVRRVGLAEIQKISYDEQGSIHLWTRKANLWRWSSSTLAPVGRGSLVAASTNAVFLRDQEHVRVFRGARPPETLNISGELVAVTEKGEHYAAISELDTHTVVVLEGQNPGTFSISVFPMSGATPLWSATHVGGRSSVEEFSSNGERFALGDEEGTVRVWDVRSGKEIARSSAAEAIRRLRFDSSATQLLVLSAGDNRTVRVLPLDLDAHTQRLCSRVSRQLTQDEWRQYFGEEKWRPTCETAAGR